MGQNKSKLKIMVLAGGPDREREVSLRSGAQITRALQQAGHKAIERDILPHQLEALDEFEQWQGEVVFPILHGLWGEGGSLQRLLDERKLAYVGCSQKAAALCMDKYQTKVALALHGLPTPAFELLSITDPLTISLPVVLKAVKEGSSIDLAICHTAKQVQHARADLHQRHPKLLAEKYIQGKELTVGIIGSDDANDDDACKIGKENDVNQDRKLTALPPICIVPATDFYDYDAKYTRTDTQYLFDAKQIGLSQSTFEQLQILSLQSHRTLGCRHLSRVDLMVDQVGQPWVIEVNTLPGFTEHSLLPMAASKAGLSMCQLVDRLVYLAAK